MIKNRKLVYLAIPYSGREEESFNVATITTTQIINTQGDDIHIFSPITYSHPIVKEGLSEEMHTYEYWLAWDFWVIKHSDELWVVKLHGWKESTGVQAEIKYATSLDIPVKYIDPLKVTNEPKG